MDLDIVILALLVVVVVLHLLPRPYVRHLRGCTAKFVFWQWKRMSRLSAIVYSRLYDRINGNNGE